MASGGSGRDTEDALSKLLQMGTVAEYESKFVILANRVAGISANLLKSFYISGRKPALQCALLGSNPTTLGKAFLLARAAEARFTNLQLWELLRSNPTTLGESFFKARIIEGCFEDENNRTFDNNVGDQEDPNVNDKQEVKRLMKILVLMSLEEVVVGCGEAFRVDDDELNRVISVLKDGGGEFDDCLDGINLDLSHDFVIRILESRDVSGRILVIFLKLVYRVKSHGAAKGGKRVLCYVQGSGRRKKKQIEAAIQRRLWDTGIKSVIQGNTLRARWFGVLGVYVCFSWLVGVVLLVKDCRMIKP
ncbi:hypothetical protein Tco_0728112 [Tanacetum coccineum]|uniref:Uncharacterized protein n=1 Tax=Tanacetum coccineum TaxID=301880 RepID=A0ABQ4YL98_9ASTR